MDFFNRCTKTCELPYKHNTTTIDKIVPQAGDTTHRYQTEHAAAPEAAHTHRDTKSFPKSVLLQCNPKWYNVYSQMRRPNLTIIWRASKLQMGPRRFPWLTGTHLDHAQGSNTGSCPNGSLQPVLRLCRASVLGNPKGYYQNSHRYCDKCRRPAVFGNAHGIGYCGI